MKLVLRKDIMRMEILFLEFRYIAVDIIQQGDMYVQIQVHIATIFSYHIDHQTQ